MTNLATAHDNRVNRVAAVLDAARPFVVLKPKGCINPILGHYTTMRVAKAAADRWNKATGRA